MNHNKEKNNRPMFFEEENISSPLQFTHQKGLIVSCVFSLLWLIFAIHYLIISGWWASRADLTPAELVGGLGGLCFPMVVAWLIGAYFDRSEQLDAEAKELRSYLNELVYPTTEGAVYNKTLTDTLRAQIKEFRSVFNEVSEQTQEVRDDLKHWVGELGSIIKQADTQTVNSVKEISNHIQALAHATEVANNQAQQASASLSGQASFLENITKSTIQATEGLNQSLQQNIADLQNIIASTNSAVIQAEESMKQVPEVISSLEKNSSKIEAAIGAYETSARQQNTRLFGNLEKVLSVFSSHGDMLDQEVARSTNRLGVVESALKESIAQLFKSTEVAVQKLTEAGNAFDQKSNALKLALSDFKSESGVVAHQIEIASREMTSLPIIQPMRTEDMLKEASSILDQLQSLSVDMAHLFTPKSEEALWEKYYAGDKAIFMRHIRTTLNGGQTRQLKELYKNDQKFKESVDKYMTAFETMTQAIGKGDNSNLLLSILIGSDVGRLYMVLADVLKGKKQ